jgi:hypothetical protein
VEVATPETYGDVFDRLERDAVRYAVISGVAVVLYGHVRPVADLDVVIDPAPDQAASALRALAACGFVQSTPLPLSMVTVMRMFDHAQREVDVFVGTTSRSISCGRTRGTFVSATASSASCRSRTCCRRSASTDVHMISRTSRHSSRSTHAVTAGRRHDKRAKQERASRKQKRLPLLVHRGMESTRTVRQPLRRYRSSDQLQDFCFAMILALMPS